MEDIERKNWWGPEMDTYLQKVKEDKIKLKIIDDSLVNLKLSKSIFDFVANLGKPKDNEKGA